MSQKDLLDYWINIFMVILKNFYKKPMAGWGLWGLGQERFYILDRWIFVEGSLHGSSAPIWRHICYNFLWFL